MKEDSYTKPAVLISVFLALCGVIYWSGIQPMNLGVTEQGIIDSFQAQQVSDLANNGEYTQVYRGVASNLEGEVHIYEAPTGKGYEVRLYKTIGQDEYVRRVGAGVEAQERTQDWTIIENDD